MKVQFQPVYSIHTPDNTVPQVLSGLGVDRPLLERALGDLLADIDAERAPAGLRSIWELAVGESREHNAPIVHTIHFILALAKAPESELKPLLTAHGITYYNVKDWLDREGTL